MLYISESVKPVQNIWYHLVPKGTDLHFGLISPYFMQKYHLTKQFHNATDKYRDRLVNAWGYYPYRDPESLTDKEITDGLKRFRGPNGDRMIYMFRYPPTKDMGPNMKALLKEKDVYEIDLSKVHDIIEIDYGYENSNSDNPPIKADYYISVSQQEYFSDYDDNAPMIFANINHIGVATRSGKIPQEALRKIS